MSEPRDPDQTIYARAPHDGQTHEFHYNGLQDDGAGGGIDLWTSDDGYTHSTGTLIETTAAALEEGE